MKAPLHQEVMLVYLTGIFLCALPLWAWRPSRPLFWPVLALFGVFSWPAWPFIWADIGAWHDHEQNLQKMIELTNQWLAWGRELGWVPYLGGGMPFSLFNNLINVPEMLIFTKLTTLWAVHLSQTQAYNLSFLLSYFGFCVGAVLLMLVFFESYQATLLGAVSLILGGLFVHDLAQPKAFTVLFAFVWPAFFLVLALKSKKPGALVLAVLSFGAMANYYVPVYGLYTLLFCLISGLIFYGRRLRPLSQFKPLVQSPLAWVLAVLVGVAIILPVGQSLLEMRDYYSPSRDSIAGTVEAGKTGLQQVHHAQLEHLAVIIDNARAGDHAGFYVGVMLVLLAPMALLGRRGWFLLLPTAMLAWLSQGTVTPLWNHAVSYWPLMSYARHAFQFGGYFCFFLLLMGLEGFIQLQGPRPVAQRLAALAFSAIGVYGLTSVLWPEATTEVGHWFFIWTPLLAALAWPWKRAEVAVVLGFSLVLLQAYRLSDQFAQSMAQRHFKAPEHWLAGFVYPQHFSLISSTAPVLPFYLQPVLLKRIDWYHENRGYLFYVQQDFFKLVDTLAQEKDLYHKSAPIYRLLAPEAKEVVIDPNRAADMIRQDIGQNESSNWHLSVNRLNPGEWQCIQAPLCLQMSSDPNEQVLKVDLAETKILWRRENWHRNWTAYLDGNPTEIKKGAHNLQYLSLPAGQHEVRFVYKSRYHQFLQIYLAVLVLGWFGKLWWLKRQEGV